KGEEKRARKTIREYLYRYVQDNESGSEDLIRWNKLYDRNEELVALLEIDENELDYTSLNNLMKINVNNPGIIDPISADFDEIIERISKLEQKLSIEKELHFYVTGLQRLKFLFKNIVLVVGDRRICAIEDLDLHKKNRKVEGKNYILATVNLPRGTPVYNLPVKYNGFPVIVDYGAMKASTSETSNRCHEYHENLKPGISISDSKCYEAFTLGKLFTAKGQSGKKYLLTVNHGVGEVSSSVVQPGSIDNINTVIVETPMPIQSEKLQVVIRTH
ncbi:23052_t:CDS:2, partial [Rhizophagus irregularis]